MIFKLAQNLSEDALCIGDDISLISNSLEEFFKEKNYRSVVKEVHIGIICVNKDFEEFFNPRGINYSKSKKILETEVKLDLLICSLSQAERLEKIKAAIYDSSLTLHSYFDSEYIIDIENFNKKPIEI